MLKKLFEFDFVMKVYLADASLLVSGDAFNKFYNEMPPGRRAKIDRCRNDKDKRLSLCAGILLKKALEDIGRSELIEEIVISEKGRPGFAKETGIDFNLSHSGDMAMCVIAHSPVGCDIQLMKPTDGKIAGRHFTEAEKNYVFEMEDPEIISDRFYRIWVMKEAYTKLSGEGISREFDSFNVLDIDSFWEMTLGDYRLCVAGWDKNEDIQVVYT